MPFFFVVQYFGILPYHGEAGGRLCWTLNGSMPTVFQQVRQGHGNAFAHNRDPASGARRSRPMTTNRRRRTGKTGCTFQSEELSPMGNGFPASVTRSEMPMSTYGV
ncbi:jg16439 [Pararge aegeria aegeria]|uniref:Jg16439 protein n=1 Tax=Pararge aegeria aegeria TaxID=348720 RepID=A0A8S4SQ16_9NEOP|nr:jg16439 [Pararge aegeria aegeria]